jgi:hypothetical protein
MVSFVKGDFNGNALDWFAVEGDEQRRRHHRQHFIAKDRVHDDERGAWPWENKMAAS